MDLSYANFQKVATPTSPTASPSGGLNLSYDSFKNQTPAPPSLLSRIGSSVSNAASGVASFLNPANAPTDAQKIQNLKDFSTQAIASVPKTIIGAGTALYNQPAALSMIPGNPLNERTAPFQPSAATNAELNIGGNSNAGKAGAIVGDLAQYAIPGEGEIKGAEGLTKLQKVLNFGANVASKGAKDAAIGTGQTGSVAQGAGIGVGTGVAGVALHSVMDALRTAKTAANVSKILTEQAGMPQAAADAFAPHIAASQSSNEIRDILIPKMENKTFPDSTQPSNSATVQPISEKPGISAPENTPILDNPVPLATDTTKTSGLATDIAAKAKDAGITDGFDNLAHFEGKTVADQAQQVANLIETDLPRAKAIAAGTEQVPQGMSASMFIKGVEEHALKNGDTKLLAELANSSLMSDTSVHAQELRFLAERDKYSPVTAAANIAKDREAAAVKSGLDVAKAKRVPSNLAGRPTRQSLSDFIDSIAC